MPTHSLFLKIFLAAWIPPAAACLALLACARHEQRLRLETLQAQELRRQLDLARDLVEDAGDGALPEADLRRFARRMGVSLRVVDAQGRSLFDTSRTRGEGDLNAIWNALGGAEAAAAGGPRVAEFTTRGAAELLMATNVAPVGAGRHVLLARSQNELDEVAAGGGWIALGHFAWTNLVFALGAWLLAGSVTTPLRRLAAPLARAAADRAPRWPPPRDDELGLVARGVAELHAALHARARQLEESCSQLTTILGSMQEGVIAVNTQQRIFMANQASREMLDFVTADLQGRPIWEATRERRIHKAVDDTLTSKTQRRLEFETLDSKRHLGLRVTCLPGEPLPGAVLVLHDLTELRRLENLRRELVANVSHELKTPLASIRAYAETLRMGAIHDPENSLHFLARIEEHSDRLNALIQDILQIARIEQGKEVFHVTDLSLWDHAQACLARFDDKARARSIALTLAIDPAEREAQVRADEEGLRTILDNLVDNALKYTPDGGRVTIRWRDVGEQTRLEVEDTGIGIAPEHHKRVFERFYRVDKARSRDLGGTGLGLSIVKNLAQAFGGAVGLVSQLGAGSKFWVTLKKA